MVRTRYVKEIPELIALGADDVIPEEFETSIEIFSRVLHNFLVPEDDIEHFIDTIRADNYELFQIQKKLPKTFRPSKFPEFNISCLRVNADSGKMINKQLKDLDLRAKFGINILGISRNDMLLKSIHPEEKILQGDLLFVSGTQQAIEQFHLTIS